MSANSFLSRLNSWWSSCRTYCTGVNKPDFWAVMTAAIVFLTWGGLFISGAWVSSGEYIHSVLFNEPLPWDLKRVPEPHVSTPQLMMYAVVAFATWTWTNLAMLSLATSILGEISRKWLGRGGSPLDYRAALVRGFIIYLIFLSGHVVILGDLASSPGGPVSDRPFSQASYSRMVGTMMLFSFCSSLRPEFIELILKRLLDSLAPGDRQPPAPRSLPADGPDPQADEPTQNGRGQAASLGELQGRISNLL